MTASDTILTLAAADRYGIAAEAFRLPHNRARYLGPSEFFDNVSAREMTPIISDGSFCTADDLKFSHCLRLSFDQQTKTPGRITFGSDPKRCDILLAAKRGQYKISGCHFYLTFDAQQRIILQDVSLNGTTVSYDGQGEDQRRCGFRWIIIQTFHEIAVGLRIGSHRRLAFNLHLPDIEDVHEERYRENVKRFIAGADEIPPNMSHLAFHSYDTSLVPSETLSPNRRPIYNETAELGEGASGRVCEVIDVTTGHHYAGKEFFNSDGWAKEVAIMRSLYHEHIVQFVDFSADPRALLVMEYLPLGNLEDQHKESPIAMEEVVVLLYQCLQALGYLHRHKITHRDIKPANILISSRDPFTVKLADFGISENKQNLQTLCGTLIYAAPEIFQGQYYSSAIDLWSLGVVVLEYGYGLPHRRRRSKGRKPQRPRTNDKDLALDWCRHLIEAAADWDSDDLIDFLTEFMLRSDPRERLSAEDCLKKGLERHLYDGALSKTGNMSSKPTSARCVQLADEDAPTLLIGTLWRREQSLVRTTSINSENQIVPSIQCPVPKNNTPDHIYPRNTRHQLRRPISDPALDQKLNKRQRATTRQPPKKSASLTKASLILVL